MDFGHGHKHEEADEDLADEIVADRAPPTVHLPLRRPSEEGGVLFRGRGLRGRTAAEREGNSPFKR